MISGGGQSDRVSPEPRSSHADATAALRRCPWRRCVSVRIVVRIVATRSPAIGFLPSRCFRGWRKRGIVPRD